MVSEHGANLKIIKASDSEKAHYKINPVNYLKNATRKQVRELRGERNKRVKTFKDEVLAELDSSLFRNLVEMDKESVESFINTAAKLRDKNRPIQCRDENIKEFILINYGRKRKKSELANRQYDIRVYYSLSKERLVDFLRRTSYTAYIIKNKLYQDSHSETLISDLSSLATQCKKIREYLEKNKKLTFEIESWMKILPPLRSSEILDFTFTYTECFVLLNSLLGSDKRFSYQEAFYSFLNDEKVTYSKVAFLTGLQKVYSARKIQIGHLSVKFFDIYVAALYEIELEARRILARKKKKSNLDSNLGIHKVLFAQKVSDRKESLIFAQAVLCDLEVVFGGNFVEFVKAYSGEKKYKAMPSLVLQSIFRVYKFEVPSDFERLATIAQKAVNRF